MNPKREKYYRLLFLVSAIYDIVLGIVFIFFSSWAFALLGIKEKLPDFGGYLSLIGAFLLVIGIAYFLIYRGNLEKNHDLITIGVLYKLAYCTIAFVYLAMGPIPHHLFVTLFGIADLIFFILMLEFRLYLRKTV
jgi:hypothetical protein